MTKPTADELRKAAHATCWRIVCDQMCLSMHKSITALADRLEESERERERLETECRGAVMLLHTVAHQSGGELRICRDVIINADCKTVERSEDFATGDVIFRCAALATGGEK